MVLAHPLETKEAWVTLGHLDVSAPSSDIEHRKPLDVPIMLPLLPG
jgi:hypothetical protein